MAKNFPYFKFVATEWLTGDIVFEDYELQGIFINVCALYWQRNGDVTIEDLQKRMKTDRLAELTDRFISVSNGFISVKFLDEQLIDAGHISKVNSDNGKLGGRPRKSETPINIEEKTDRLATVKRTESEIKQSKEEEKKGKEEEEINSFKVSISEYGGTKRGAATELENLKKKHKDWKDVLPLIAPAIENQKKYRDAKKAKGVFVAEWKNLQTWINQRCWEEVVPTFEEVKKTVYNIPKPNMTGTYD